MPDMNTYTDLRVFCDIAPHGQYDLTKPFVRSGWKYATDGRIAIRVPDGGVDMEGKFPKVEFVFEGFPICDQPLPELAPVVEIDCRRCHASGRVPGKCEMCDGPMERCFVCNGAKRVVVRKGEPSESFPGGVIELVDGLLDPWYLYLIESRCQNVRHAAAMSEYRLQFTADGGAQIVLYGITPE